MITQMMESQTQLGTPLYMAPEIKIGSKYTSSVDIYSCGILFLELILPIEDKRKLLTLFANRIYSYAE